MVNNNVLAISHFEKCQPRKPAVTIVLREYLNRGMEGRAASNPKAAAAVSSQSAATLFAGNQLINPNIATFWPTYLITSIG